MTSPGLTKRFDEAFLFAHELHGRQVRKGTQVPYIAHLMSVAALVIEDGGDEDQAIAALLHDAAEDQGGLETLEEIRTRFGDTVSAIVRGCSDTFANPKPPWRARKDAYLHHLETASPAVRRVSLADKLHNARTLLSDLRIDGISTFERFRGGKEGTLWYYHSLVNIFEKTSESPMVYELAQVVDELERIANGL